MTLWFSWHGSGRLTGGIIDKEDNMNSRFTKMTRRLFFRMFGAAAVAAPVVIVAAKAVVSSGSAPGEAFTQDGILHVPLSPDLAKAMFRVLPDGSEVPMWPSS